MSNSMSAERVLSNLQTFVMLQYSRTADLFPMLMAKGRAGVSRVETWRVRLATETIDDPTHPLNADLPAKPSLPAHPGSVSLLTRPATQVISAAGVPEPVVEAAVVACEVACFRLADEFNKLAGKVPRDRERLVVLVRLFDEATYRLGRVREWLRRPLRRRNVPLVLTPLQKAILNALDGKALSQTELEKATRTDRAQLHRKNGLKSLIGSGHVVRGGRGVGYYRPDAPPPDALSP